MGLCGIGHVVSSLAWDWRRVTVEPPKIISGEGGGTLGLMKRFQVEEVSGVAHLLHLISHGVSLFNELTSRW
jgi:hypothetical protein